MLPTLLTFIYLVATMSLNMLYQATHRTSTNVGDMSTLCTRHLVLITNHHQHVPLFALNILGRIDPVLTIFSIAIVTLAT